MCRYMIKNKFTPLCVSVDGMLGSEAAFFVKRMSDFLAAKWERPYSVVSLTVSDGAYPANGNALRGRGSGHARD